MVLSFLLSGPWHFFFNPTTGQWYTGNVYGNVVALVPCGILAWIWTRAAVRAIHRKLDRIKEKHDHQIMLSEEIHHILHHGKPHPRVLVRDKAEIPLTPTLAEET